MADYRVCLIFHTTCTFSTLKINTVISQHIIFLGVPCNYWSPHVPTIHCTYYIDSIREGYQQLRALVMAYGDINPESPLSMSQVTVTTVTSSQQTTPTPEMATPTLHNIESAQVQGSHGDGVGGGGEEGDGGSEGKSSHKRSLTVPYPTPEVASKMKVRHTHTHTHTHGRCA